MDNQKFYTTTDRFNQMITLNAQGLRSLADAYLRIAEVNEYRCDILRTKMGDWKKSTEKLSQMALELKELSDEISFLRKLATNYYVISA